MNYKNYNLRSLTPESAASWRKSIVKSSGTKLTENIHGENEVKTEDH